MAFCHTQFNTCIWNMMGREMTTTQGRSQDLLNGEAIPYGSLQSLDWTGGLNWWTGLVDWTKNHFYAL